MSIDLLVNECERLAESYCLASEARGRAEALSPDDETEARRRMDTAFYRFLQSIENLKLQGEKIIAGRLMREALHDAMWRARKAQVEALASMKGAA